jgi:hypothetical protein
MKIVNDSNNKQTVDLDALIDEAFQKYDAVFFSEIEGQLFAYRPLGRKEYKDIIEDVNITDLDKQDKICKTVLFYPPDFDFDECSAGIPDRLYNDVMEKSCLDPESMMYLLHMERQRAEQLGSEMTCIIAEAFPNYSIDEIESWNNFKFMKIFSQAEWTLKNIRGIEFNMDIIDYLAEASGVTQEELVNLGIKESVNESQPVQQHQQQRPQQQQQVKQQKQTNGIYDTAAPGMTDEQYRAYQEFCRQHPEFADKMQYDAAFTGAETKKSSVVAPALREGWYRDH